MVVVLYVVLVILDLFINKKNLGEELKISVV
jgi:hypothetical protein